MTTDPQPAVPPSGAQYDLRAGEQHAVITQVGGGLRSYRVGERPVLDGYPIEEMCTGARGQTLIRWPNRIADGRYHFDGADHSLALTEPDQHNAIHGLTRWANWEPVHHEPSRLTLRLTLHAQTGWPFVLACRLDYRLGPEGLAVATSATNVGAHPCPYATGAHPYLTVATPTIDEADATVPARTYYPTDHRGIPTGHRDVAGTGYDLREARRLGTTAIDVAYTDLERDPDGRARVHLSRPDGPHVALWLSEAYPFVEIFTGDALPEPDRRRTGLGVEPMTAAPNAFQTGDGLITLHPGQTHEAAWGIEPGP